MPTTFRSFAKVNLHLQVTGRRDDGYHELSTVFQTVDLADRLTLDLEAHGVELKVAAGAAPAGEENIAYRAAIGFLTRWAPEAGVRIDLEKRIPVGGGLGGGSSNAATVLLGLQRMLGVPATRSEMLELASELGADVPYFLWGGTAWGRGRGDVIETLPDLLERSVVLVTPPIGISTAQVFGKVQLTELENRSPFVDGGLIKGMTWETIQDGWNDLEKTVLGSFPLVRDVYNVLAEAGATVVRLSGTGATLFALFEDGACPAELTTDPPFGSRVVQARTLTRSSLDRLLVVR